ncbi:hypothetical protein GK047_15935 [Paenibacillus sp. SYP-B3998]|uniref:Uncharacterized protein n=1 Tax=Paenibacillus sp. SYP-B3998 TaxID=2678564 RepID=A0A6G3ZZ50_9BACL|nr:hypothetical protein [Paenibacillus sp. SYP-B3998]NEW07496.1 hypothetical protein [Paenibacillus sp. SYP-B3998]
MAKMSNRLYEWASWNKALLLFILALVCLIWLDTVNAPFTVLRFSEVAGGFPMIDLLWNYDVEHVGQLLTGYGEAGRNYYYYMLSVVDIPLPLMYGFGLSLMIAQVSKWALPAGRGGYRLHMLPLIAMLADYLENISILTLLLQYPHQQAWVAVAANLFTLVKTTLTSASFLLLIVLLVLRPLKKRSTAREL